MLALPNASGTLQNVQWKEELPPAAGVEQAAASLLVALATGDESSPGALFAPSIDRARARKTLRRLALEHGVCKPERGRVETERTMLQPQTPSAVYELACSERPLVLTFKLDEATGKVTEFTGHPPRSPTATCWQ